MRERRRLAGLGPIRKGKCVGHRVVDGPPEQWGIRWTVEPIRIG